MRQVRNGCGVMQVPVDPQKGSARGARLFVRGGVCPLDAPAQGLLLCAPARACGRFGPGARSYLGAPRAPVGACRCCGGHRVTLSAESAGVWEVGGRRPRVEGSPVCIGCMCSTSSQQGKWVLRLTLDLPSPATPRLGRHCVLYQHSWDQQEG